MKAMILAAGRGSRLGALTRFTPKPMIRVAGKPLIVYALESLKKAGIRYCVINLNYLGYQIRDYLRQGKRWGLQLRYSEEQHNLETGGGIRKALPLLGGRHPFLVVNADLLHNVNMRAFVSCNARMKTLAHLILKRSANGQGDFSLRRGKVLAGGGCVFCGISVLHPLLFRYSRNRSFLLADLLNAAIQNGEVSGELHSGYCLDLGTETELAAARQAMRARNIGSSLG